jgi:creatinine amidohydrolase
MAPDRRGPSILAGTLADLTYPELDELARQKAVLLWALGVIEEHGPHLPLATDVYIPAVTLDLVRQRLQEQGVPAAVIPPFYWGVNTVTQSFPGSIQVRPEIMRELIVDVLGSLRDDGFETVFCFTGHGDAAHNRTIADGVRLARDRCGVRAYFVLGAMGAFRPERFSFDLTEPCFVTITPPATRPGTPSPAGQCLDVHAGEVETSVLLGYAPEVVREEIARTLPPTRLGMSELSVWRCGGEQARCLTPHGYFGAPAAASPEHGQQLTEEQACLITAAIVARLEQDSRAAPHS